MELVKKASYFVLNNPKAQLAPLVFVLAIAGFFYFHNLGTDHITLWDEAVHANVVKNLANDCCVPKLHLTDIGIDFQDWTNNYIWVHKPLMPLFLQAVFYKISPTLFAFRLPGVLFSIASIIALFYAARRHFGYIVAIISASLFAFNSYLFELVKGRQFSGLHDLMFVFFGILALDRILAIIKASNTEFLSLEGARSKQGVIGNERLNHPTLTLPLKGRESKKDYLLFGLFAGLGYLSKGGLALLFFPALFIVSLITQDRKRSILNFLYAALIALLIVFLEKLALLLLYPAEYFFEQSVQVLHLFKDLEYWGRPWDFYITIYLRDMLLPYLYLPVLAGITWGLYCAKYDKRILVLAVWVLSFFISLSFGISKISNFIFTALPPMLILAGLMFEWLWLQKKYAVLFGLSSTALLSYFIIRLDLWRVKYHLFQDQEALQRFAILLYALLLFAALWVVYRLLEKIIRLGYLSKTFAVLSLFLILGTYARANQLSDNKIWKDYQYQQKIKQAALSLKDKYPSDSIFLLDYPGLLKPHLFFQYWSGRDAMEIYDRQPIFVLKKILPPGRPLLVLSEDPLRGLGLELIKKDDFGYIYRYLPLK